MGYYSFKDVLDFNPESPVTPSLQDKLITFFKEIKRYYSIDNDSLFRVIDQVKDDI